MATILVSKEVHIFPWDIKKHERYLNDVDAVFLEYRDEKAIKSGLFYPLFLLGCNIHFMLFFKIPRALKLLPKRDFKGKKVHNVDMSLPEIYNSVGALYKIISVIVGISASYVISLLIFIQIFLIANQQQWNVILYYSTIYSINLFSFFLFTWLYFWFFVFWSIDSRNRFMTDRIDEIIAKEAGYEKVYLLETGTMHTITINGVVKGVNIYLEEKGHTVKVV